MIQSKTMRYRCDHNLDNRENTPCFMRDKIHHHNGRKARTVLGRLGHCKYDIQVPGRYQWRAGGIQEAGSS